MKIIKANPKNIKTVCGNLDHPEGIACDSQGNLYAGGELGQIFYIDVEKGTFECIAKTGGFILGITLDGKGRIYACDGLNNNIIRCLPDGQFNTYIGCGDEIILNSPNYSVFDTEGRLFFSESGSFWNPSGRLWVKEPGTRPFPLTNPKLPFPNGLCIDNEEGYLYIVFSTVHEISRIKIKNNRLVGKMEKVLTLPSQIIPDGIALDVNRNLWVSCYRPDEIIKISKKGNIEIIIEDPSGSLLNRPTNLVLERNKIYYANLGGRHIGSFDIEVEPIGLNYPIF